MSTGLECEIVNLNDGRSFYVLQNAFCPESAWDWREHEPTVGGPFPGQEAAEKHLRQNHANPGGHCVTNLAVEELIADKTLLGLLAGKSVFMMPEPSSPPTDVASVLAPCAHRSAPKGGVWKIAEAPYGSPVNIKAFSGWGDDCEPVAVADIIALRRETGIEIVVGVSEGDASVLEEDLEREMRAVAARIYPGERIDFHIGHADSLEIRYESEDPSP